MTLILEQRTVYQLLIADYFSATAMKSRRYQQVIQELFQGCWQWLETKTVRTEGISRLLDEGQTLVACLSICRKRAKQQIALFGSLFLKQVRWWLNWSICIRGDKFLPGLIEGALLDEVFDYFDKELGWLVSMEVKSILENDFQNTLSSLQTYNRQELLASLDLLLAQGDL